MQPSAEMTCSTCNTAMTHLTHCSLEWQLTPEPQPLQRLPSPMPLDPTARQASPVLLQTPPLLQVHFFNCRHEHDHHKVPCASMRVSCQLFWYRAGSAANSAASAAGANSTGRAAVEASAVSAIGAVAAASVRFRAGCGLSTMVQFSYGVTFMHLDQRSSLSSSNWQCTEKASDMIYCRPQQARALLWLISWQPWRALWPPLSMPLPHQHLLPEPPQKLQLQAQLPTPRPLQRALLLPATSQPLLMLLPLPPWGDYWTLTFYLGCYMELMFDIRPV